MFGRINCLLSRHDDMPVFGESTFRLRCQKCGRETPGWTVGAAGTEPEPEPPTFLERFGQVLALLMLTGIVWAGPKLTPEEAAAILRPHAFTPVTMGTGPTFVVVPDTTPKPTWPVQRPLNCCSVYRSQLPYPTVYTRRVR